MLEDALKEQGVEVFQADEGFFTYKNEADNGTKFLQVVSAYLKPDHRTLQSGVKLLDSFVQYTKEQDVGVVAWPIEMKDPNKENQLLMCLHCGLKVQNADAQKLVLVKQV